MVTFSKGEMEYILRENGYAVESYKAWGSRSVYHNDVEFFDVNLDVAYKEFPDILIESVEESMVQHLRVEKVFNRLLKSKVTELLLNNYLVE